jgi:hypothetical protein
MVCALRILVGCRADLIGQMIGCSYLLLYHYSGMTHLPACTICLLGHTCLAVEPAQAQRGRHRTDVVCLATHHHAGCCLVSCAFVSSFRYPIMIVVLMLPPISYRACKAVP